jgi:hypothetical protein
LQKRVEPIDEKRTLTDVPEKHRVLSLFFRLGKVERALDCRLEDVSIKHLYRLHPTITFRLMPGENEEKMKKTFSTVVLASLLIGVLFSAVKIQCVNAEGTIYITV